MHLNFEKLVNEHFSKPITGILHIGSYDKDLHSKYKCYSNTNNIHWLNINDIYDDVLFSEIYKDVNFLNITTNGSEIMILHKMLSFIHKKIDFIYVQIFEDYKCTEATFEDLNILMVNCNFHLKVYNMINETGYTHYGGALYAKLYF